MDIFHHLFSLHKGKGILVPAIFMASVVGSVICFGVLDRNIDWINKLDLSYSYALSVGFLIAGTWIWFIRDSYYIHEGKKVLLEGVVNAWMFIPMQLWAYVAWVSAVLVFVEQYFDNF